MGMFSLLTWQDFNCLRGHILCSVISGLTRCQRPLFLLPGRQFYIFQPHHKETTDSSFSALASGSSTYNASGAKSASLGQTTVPATGSNTIRAK